MKYNFDLDVVYNNSLSIIARQIKKNSTVLEFGPANGRLTRFMKENLSCRVYLVEIDEQAGRDALRYAEDLLVDDIENFEWLDKYADIRFDYIIFADVLEHLHNPKKVLQKSKLLLKETGSVLLSVPNIAHNSVVINLINNKFEYTDIGLLDNTHIHFFTKESLEEMALEAGLFPSKRMAAYNEAGDNEIKNSYFDVKGIDDSFWRTREYGCVYQYIYELKTGRVYISETLDNIVKYYPSYFIRFIFDTGDGFKEDNFIQYAIEDITEEKVFRVELPAGTKGIKVIPVNSCCILENVKASFGTDNQTELQYTSSNLDALEGGQYYFFNENPEICYNIPVSGKCTEFSMALKYVTLSRRDLNLLYDTMIKVKNQYTK